VCWAENGRPPWLFVVNLAHGKLTLASFGPEDIQAPLAIPAGFWRAHRKPRAYLARSQSHKYRAKHAICGCLVTPLPGGLGPRSGGITTAPQGACWTGTGRQCPRPRKRGPGEQKLPANKPGLRKLVRVGAERRPRSRQWSAARRKTGAPLGAPSPRTVEGEKKAPRSPGRERRRTRRRKEYGRRSVGCLKIESADARVRDVLTSPLPLWERVASAER
jgi:hypothetical protein